MQQLSRTVHSPYRSTRVSEGVGPQDPESIHRLRWAVLAVMCLSLVLIVMANSVLNVALPTLVRELGATGTQLQWIIDAYALVFGGLLLTMGAVGDRFGRRGALQGGLVVFGLASVLSMFAQDAVHLIFTRALMGVGGALVMPATLSIISTVFPREERGKAMGIWAAFAGIGGAIGPVVGGWLLQTFAWQSIFFLNVPVILIALVAGILIVPTSRDPAGARLDIIGAGLSVLALASLLYAIIEGPSLGWFETEVVGAMVVAAIAWPAFIWWELRTPTPMLPLRFFRERGFSTGNLAIGLSFFVMFAFFFIMTQYLQFVRDFSPLQAGIRTLPMAAGLILAAPQSDRLAGRFGTPAAVTIGLALVTVGLTAMSFIGTGTPYGFLAVAFLVLGLGMGLAMAPSTTLIMDSVPPHKAGVGSAMNDTSREVGGAVGIAVLGSILNAVFRNSAEAGLPDGLTGSMREAATDSVGSALGIAAQSGQDLGLAIAQAAHAAFVDALGVAFAVGAGVALMSAVTVRVLMPRRARFVADDDMGPPVHDPLHARVDSIYDSHAIKHGLRRF